MEPEVLPMLGKCCITELCPRPELRPCMVIQLSFKQLCSLSFVDRFISFGQFSRCLRREGTFSHGFLCPVLVCGLRGGSLVLYMVGMRGSQGGGVLVIAGPSMSSSPGTLTWLLDCTCSGPWLTGQAEVDWFFLLEVTPGILYHNPVNWKRFQSLAPLTLWLGWGFKNLYVSISPDYARHVSFLKMLQMKCKKSVIFLCRRWFVVLHAL
jgi:hypothetical protein